jgi:hypothetical protein
MTRLSARASGGPPFTKRFDFCWSTVMCGKQFYTEGSAFMGFEEQRNRKPV